MIKRRSQRVGIAVILIGVWLFSLPSDVNAEEDWILYGITKYLILFYDSKSITHPSENIMRLWIKSVSKCNDKEEWIVKNHPNCRNVEWVVVVTLTEIDCSGGQDRDIKSIGFSKEGRQVESLSDETSPWSDIIPDSYAGVLYKSICPPRP
jgi:hypothetical protein